MKNLIENQSNHSIVEFYFTTEIRLHPSFCLYGVFELKQCCKTIEREKQREKGTKRKPDKPVN